MNGNSRMVVSPQNGGQKTLFEKRITIAVEQFSWHIDFCKRIAEKFRSQGFSNVTVLTVHNKTQSYHDFSNSIKEYLGKNPCEVLLIPETSFPLLSTGNLRDIKGEFNTKIAVISVNSQPMTISFKKMQFIDGIFDTVPNAFLDKIPGWVQELLTPAFHGANLGFTGITLN
ncbi:Uncharacterised protein [Candidatus Gugararchaeum adminiculabundum]|nr:Uncharacterised protein [Candidatus Gugararchaeum adminiculabundum]